MDTKLLEDNDDYFLNFDNTTFNLEAGYWIKFEVKRVAPNGQRPHGLKYSLTLHRSDGARVLGFDNAHNVKKLRSGYRSKALAYDHWHRTELDEGQPYQFLSVEKLLEDFYKEVDFVLQDKK